MANTGVASILIFLIFSLTFSSVVISFLLLNAFAYTTEGAEKSIQFANINMPGLQDYTTDSISDSANYFQTGALSGDYIYVPGIGRVLQNNDLGLEPKLIVRGVQPSNGVYKVIYKINNSVHADFTVYPRYWGAAGYANIPVKITTDKVEILAFHEYTADASAYVSGANTKDHVEIKTEFNPTVGTLNVYYDNNLILSRSGYDSGGVDNYYAGVMSKQNGFTIESINVGLINLSTGTDILSQTSGFLDILSTIIIWNVNPAFLPWELNLIFIKTQVIGILVCIFVWLRG